MKSRTGFTVKNFLREAIEARAALIKNEFNLTDEEVQWVLTAIMRNGNLDRAFMLEAVNNLRTD